MADLNRVYQDSPGVAVAYSFQLGKNDGFPKALKQTAENMHAIKAAEVQTIYTDFPMDFQKPINAYLRGTLNEAGFTAQMNEVYANTQQQLSVFSVPEGDSRKPVYDKVRELLSPPPVTAMIAIAKEAKEAGIKQIVLLDNEVADSIKSVVAKTRREAQEQAENDAKEAKKNQRRNPEAAKSKRNANARGVAPITMESITKGLEAERQANEESWSMRINKESWVDTPTPAKYLLITRLEYDEPAAGVKDSKTLPMRLGQLREDKSREGIPVLLEIDGQQPAAKKQPTAKKKSPAAPTAASVMGALDTNKDDLVDSEEMKTGIDTLKAAGVSAASATFPDPFGSAPQSTPQGQPTPPLALSGKKKKGRN